MTSDLSAPRRQIPDDEMETGGGIVAAAAAVVFLALVVWIVAVLLRGAGSTRDLGQPRVEREAQQRLPHSLDPVWRTLRTTKVSENEQSGSFVARFPPAVQALAGKTISVDGFMLPLESNVETHHFLLSKYTPVCPFCPPGQPNEVIEVYSATTVIPTTEEVTVTGRFSIHGQDGLFFQLHDADVHALAN